jgi:hypothetical protein
MPNDRRRIYALSGYTVERKKKGWFFRRTDYQRDKWRGPYSSETSACLTIARLLKKELAKRDDLSLAV